MSFKTKFGAKPVDVGVDVVGVVVVGVVVVGDFCVGTVVPLLIV